MRNNSKKNCVFVRSAFQLSSTVLTILKCVTEKDQIIALSIIYADRLERLVLSEHPSLKRRRISEYRKIIGLTSGAGCSKTG